MRVAIVGATGSLGGELLAVLDESTLPVDALVPIATDRSLGVDVEFRGGMFPVETGLSALRGAQLAFLCAPPEASLEAGRALLHARVPAIDCSGAFAGAPEVPLVAELGVPGVALDAPVLAVPPGVSLAVARVLAPIARRFGVERVVATLALSASSSGMGRAAVEALAEETIALLSQQEPPDPPALGHPCAFDLLPWVGATDAGGATAHEREFAAIVARATGAAGLAVTSLRMPTFAGDGASLAIETRDAADPDGVVEELSKAAGVVLAAIGPTTRAAAGSDLVHVGRVRRDPSRASGVLLWIAVDAVRVTAAHAVRVAEARFGRV
jgi:aspartate-semialdehyde dehydrogenase